MAAHQSPIAHHDTPTHTSTATRPKVTLRPATLQDASSIAQIGIHTFTTTFAHSLPASELRAYLDDVYSPEATTKDIVDPNKDMLVATITIVSTAEHPPREQVIGFALLTRGTTDPCLSSYNQDTLIELQRIYIHPSHQGHGAGKLLARELESKARSQGYEYIWLGVWEENFKAQKVYAGMGYRRVGEHAFVMGREVQTDWILVKEL